MQVFSQNILRETVLPDDLAEKHGARLQRSFKSREIDIDQSETRLETSPFIIIHERPAEITAQINPPAQGVVNRGEIKSQIDDPEAVVAAAAAVFRNIRLRLTAATESQIQEGRVFQQLFRHWNTPLFQNRFHPE